MPTRATGSGLALVVCALAFALTLHGIVRLDRALVIVACFAWFALPGLLAFGGAMRASDRSRVVQRVIAALCGYAASSVVLLALWVSGLRNGILVLGLAPAIAAVLLRIIASFAAPLPAPRTGVRDGTWLLATLLLVPLVVGVPFSKVGEITPEGRTYRAYFTADFVWRMAVTAELAHGDVPPKNQYFRGDDLRYYWMPDLPSAIEYRLLNRQVRLEQVLLVNAVCIGSLFLAVIFAFARMFVPSAGAAFSGVAASVLFSSFEGAERLYFLWRHRLPLDLVRLINIDAVTRWYHNSLPVDGLQRALLWQPQHAVAYSLSFAALACVLPEGSPPRAPRLGRAAVAGVALAFAMLFSSFIAIMMIPIVCIVALSAYAVQRRWRDGFLAAPLLVLPGAAAAAVAIALHYVDRSESIVRLLVNPMAVAHPYVSIGLSFGPLIVPATIGAWYAARRDAWGAFALVTTVAIAFFFYFFVDVRDHQYVYVGWRAGHFVFIACAALIAIAGASLWEKGRVAKWTAGLLAAIVAAAAAPMTAIDLYNAQDTANREQGPGFRWTLVVSNDELAALEWIKRFTPADALVQVEPHVRQNDTWAYVPAFAERRMSAGIPISMVPLDKYLKASERVRSLYAAPDAATASKLAVELRVDYLVVGPPERAAFPRIESLCDAHPELFRPVFRNREMTVYFVERDRSAVLP